MLTAIRQWVIKTMMKGQTGVVQTLPKKEIIEMNVQITAQRLMKNGINPNDLKTVGQVENVVNQIDQPKVNVNPGMTSVKKADVLDMEGNKIPEGSGIMAGKEINQKNLNEELMKTDNPYSELVNTPRPRTLVEREADVLAGMEKNNKEIVQRIRDRKKAELDDPEEKAEGGRIGLLAGSVPKLFKFLKSKKKIDEAVNNIFPTGDYKYDAQMAADSLVENNPQIFGGKLYEDLDIDTQMQVYGAVIGPIQNNALAVSRIKKATKPEKTLQSMKEGKGINMSDPDIADEFARFMKETDPKGTKDIEEKILLESFDPKRTKGNADGGRIGLEGGTNEDFQKYLKERERFEKERGLEQLFREYQEDLRRQEVGEQKQMAADGGRIGLKAGMTKRNFLKLMGSVGAGIGAVKSGIFSGLGKGATKQVAKEVAQQTTSSMPPPYFFKLAEKIKMMGDDVTATTDRTIAKKLPSKDGKSEYLLEEDMVTGDTSIKKIYKEDDNMITDVEIMELRKGEVVQTKDGKAIKTPDEYEEVTEVNKRIYKDDYNASDYTDGINVDEIIKEVDDQAPPIKYASGGLAYMLGE